MNSPRLVVLAFALMLLSASGVARGAATEIDAIYADAVARFAVDDFDGALIQVKNVLQQQPDHAGANVLIGRIYMATGRQSLAEAAFSAARKLGAAPAEIEPYRAAGFLQQGQYRRLIEQVPVAGLTGEALAKVLAARGQAYLALGKFADAERSFAGAIEQADALPDGHTGMASLRLGLGDLAGAEREAEAALQRGQRDVAAWIAWATVQQALGAQERALQGYDYVLALDPHNLPARLARLEILLQLGRLDDMRKDFDALASTDPLDPRGMLLKAQWLARRGEADAAKAQLTEAANVLKAIPDEVLAQIPQFLLVSGAVHYALGELGHAREDLTRYVDRVPGHVGARQMLATILMRQGQPEQALAMLEPVRAQAAGDARFLAQLGAAYMALGRQAQAIQVLEEAAKLDAGAPEVADRLAEARFRGGQQGQAMQDLADTFEQHPDRQTSGLMLAIMQMRTGKLKEAVATTSRLVEAAPDDVVLLNFKARAQAADGDLDGAYATLEHAVAVDPKQLPLQMNLARLDVRRGQVDKAIERLDAQIKAHPDNMALLEEAGALYAKVNRPDAAQVVWEYARRLDDRALPPRLALVEIYLRTRQPDKALALANETAAVAAASPTDARNPAVFAALGMAQLAAGLPEQARGSFRRLLGVVPETPAAYLRVARYQLLARDYPEAADTLERALRMDPRNTDVLVAATETYLAAGKLTEAEARARRLHAAGATPVSYGLLGEVLQRQGKAAEAAELYTAGYRQFPRPALVAGAYRSLASAGRLDAAVALLQEWITAHPDDDPGITLLAEGFLRQGNWQVAAGTYEHLLAKRPDSVVLLNNLALAYLHLSDPRARDAAQRAAALAPDNGAVLDTLGWVLTQQGDAALGLPYLRTAQTRLPDNPEVSYHLGIALHRQGQTDEARVHLARAVASGKPFPGVEDAQQVLGTLKP